MKRLFKKLNIGKWLRKTRLSNKLYYYTIIVVIFAVFGSTALWQLTHPRGSEAAWFDENYLYRQAIPVTSTEGAVQQNVFVSFTLDTATLITAGKLQSSCQDLRLTDQEGNVLKYHIGRVTACNNAATTVDFLLDSFPDGLSTYYVYYGNSQVRSADAGVLSVSAASTATVTVSGNEITDATRTTNTQGDGVTPPDSSYGIWQAATNLVTNGGAETNTTGWGGPHGTETMTRDATYTKFGSYALKVTTPGNVSAEGAYISANGGGSLTSGTTYTYSGWYWLPVGALVEARVYRSDDYSNTDFLNLPLGTGTWQKFSLTFTAAASVNHYVYIRTRGSLQAISFWMDGIQVETGSIATPYIETDGGTASRTAARVQASSNLINNKQSWVAMRVRIGATAAQQASQYFLHWYTSNNERMGLFYNTTGYECFVITNGEYKPTTLITLNPAVGDMVTLIWRLDTTTGPRASCSVNGSAFTVGAPAVAASAINASTFDIGRTTDGNNIGNGTVLWTAAGTGTLTDADASTLNGYGNTDPTLAQLASLNGGIAKSTFLWTADTSADTQTTFSQGPARNYTIGSLATEEKSPSPVAYWAFDEGTGNVASSSASPNLPAQLMNGPVWTPESQCVVGKCLQFDGTNDFAQVNITQLPTGDFTYSAWVNLQTVNDEMIFMSQGDTGNEFIFYVVAGKLQVSISGAGQTVSTNSITANTWTHIAVTRSGSTISYYINGVLDPTSVSSGTVLNFVGCQLLIGTDADSGCTGSLGNYANGRIDEAKVYNFALSAAQVKANYNSRGGLNGQANVLGATQNSVLSNGLVGYWKMDEASWNGTASEVIDSSGNANNGTSVSGANASPSAKFGNAGYFAGIDEYVSVTPSFRGTLTSFTVGQWVYMNSLNGTTSNQYSLFFNLNGQSLYPRGYVKGDGVVTLQLKTGGVTQALNTSAGAVTAGKWYHIVYTFRSSDNYSAIYVDGTLKVSTTFSSGTLDGSTSGAMFLGFDSNLSIDLNGNLDETRIYNRAMDPMEVQQLYNFAPGPVGYWNFEEGQGSVVNDSSTYGNNGAWSGTGTTHWASGKYGKGGSFNGVDDGVQVTNSSSLNPAFISVSAWIKSGSSVSDMQIASKDCTSFTCPPSLRVWQFKKSANVLTFIVFNQAGSNNTAAGTTMIADSKWHFVEGTWDGATIKVYVDGKLEGSQAFAGTSLQTGQTNDFFIGRSQNSGGGYWSGQIDQVRVYNYAQTPGQIVSDMQAGAPGVTASGKNTIGYWKFDEGFGTTANSSGVGGSSVNGTLTNMNSPAVATSGWTQDGKFSKALSFDGTNDYVSVADNTALDFGAYQDFSYSLWVRRSENSTSKFLISKGATSTAQVGYSFQLQSGITPLFSLSKTGESARLSVSATRNITDTAWHHLAVSINRSGNGYIYLDGQQIGSGDVSSYADADFSNSFAFAIGCTHAGATCFPGVIDEVKIYNYALTALDVKTEYNHGSSLVLGSFGMSADGVASNAASAIYCVPGDTSQSCSPVGEWKFEEARGSTVNDTSGNSNTGTWNGTGATHWSQGKVGWGGNFNGTSDYVNVADSSSLDVSSQVTMSAWVKGPFTSMGTAGIISKDIQSGITNPPYVLQFASGTSLQMVITDSSNGFDIASVSLPSDNQWHYVAGTYDGATLKLYIDGILKGSTAAVNDIAVTTGSLKIGQQKVGSSRFFSGQIDQARIYDYALSAAQVAWEYNYGKPVAQWRFDECQGSTANDASGNGNTGTIQIGPLGTQTTVGTCQAVNTAAAWYNGRSGKFNYSLNFDGTDDYVRVADQANLDFTAGSSFSVSTWYKKTTGNARGVVCKKGIDGSAEAGYCIRIDSGGNLYFSLGDGSNSLDPTFGGGAYADNVWHHFVATVNSSQIKLYADGVLKSTTTNTLTGSYANSLPLVVGTIKSGGVNHFNGQIDDVQIYNYDLTAVQVKNVYNQNSSVRFGPLTGSP